ncbi:MAG TPA: hypothetical protein VM557_14695 [Thermoanaerobaculia bacterium]|nr:hypothetical protein [Thermoanaerobaculia bacterium]
MIWREKRWLLAIIGVLLLANLVFFFTYRVRFQQRVESLDSRLEQTREELQTARADRAAAEQEVATYLQIETGIERVYSEIWATPEERLTPLLLEMRELARRSELQPPAVVYNQTTFTEQQGGTSSLEISFGVRGSYRQIRRLINLIELSNQFVIIDEIGLNGITGGDLQLTLNLRTLFRNPTAGGSAL